MTTIAQSLRSWDKPLAGVIGVGGVLLLAAALAIPNLFRARLATPARPSLAPSSESMAVDQSGPSDARMVSMPSSSPVAAELKAKAQPATAGKAGVLPDRKIVQTGALELRVKSPADAAEKIRIMAEGMGGYLESAQIGGSKEAPVANLTIRIPVAHFEDAKAGIRKLATRVENEKTDAQDVTRQYVDMEARLRNLRAEEAQYLTILKSAYKVDDLLNVSEKLSEVRGEIEQQQGEFQVLSKQIEMVTISVGLRAETDTLVWGLNWRPLYQIKVAARNGLEGLADFATAIVAIVFYMPVILAWAATIFIAMFAGWRTLLWLGRVFAWAKPAAPEKAVSSL